MASEVSSDPEFGDGFFTDLHAGIVGRVKRGAQLVADEKHLREAAAATSRWASLRRVAWIGAMAATLLIGLLLGRGVDLAGNASDQHEVLPFGANEALSVMTGRDQHFRQMFSDPEFQRWFLERIRGEFAENRAGGPGLDGGIVIQASDPGRTLARGERDL
jgi:hypothetical protein